VPKLCELETIAFGNGRRIVGKQSYKMNKGGGGGGAFVNGSKKGENCSTSGMAKKMVLRPEKKNPPSTERE